MILSNFKSKLRELNPDLIVKDDQVSKMRGFNLAGIYLKMKAQKGLSPWLRGFGEGDAVKFCDAQASGQLDKHLCGVCIDWIPEYDVFNADYSCLSVPGWRTILLRLVATKVISLQRAQKVFDCRSLGESDYDKASYHNKLRIAKKLDGF